MQHRDFKIGAEFTAELIADKKERWRCTDIGTRVITAIRVDQTEVRTYHEDTDTWTSVFLTKAEAEADGWFSGPSYSVAEVVFDEDLMELCEPVDD